ncbi:hypothetical protein KCU67_g123, partial [Aureobasidium melanogenum]
MDGFLHSKDGGLNPSSSVLIVTYKIHACCGHNHLFCLLEFTIFCQSRFNMCLQPGAIRTPHSPISLSMPSLEACTCTFVQVALLLAHSRTVHLLSLCVIARGCVDSHGSENAGYKTSGNCISPRYRGFTLGRRRTRDEISDT